METVTQCRKFMSAARAASRVKPVIVVKPVGPARGRAAARHTGAVAATTRSAMRPFAGRGCCAVHEMQALFDAVETLAMMPHRISGDRLAILTNGVASGSWRPMW